MIINLIFQRACFRVASRELPDPTELRLEVLHRKEAHLVPTGKPDLGGQRPKQFSESPKTNSRSHGHNRSMKDLQKRPTTGALLVTHVDVQRCSRTVLKYPPPKNLHLKRFQASSRS